jgi:hypothetical protein
MKMAVFWVLAASIIRANALVMEVASTSVNIYQTTRRYNPEDSHLCKINCIIIMRTL